VLVASVGFSIEVERRGQVAVYRDEKQSWFVESGHLEAAACLSRCCLKFESSISCSLSDDAPGGAGLTFVTACDFEHEVRDNGAARLRQAHPS